MTSGDIRSRIEAVRSGFFSNPSGFRAEGALCQIADDFVRQAWTGESWPDHVAVLAVGGYGRGTLSPGSDLDFLALAGDEGSPDAVAPLFERLAGSPFPFEFQAVPLADFDSFDPGQVGAYLVALESRYLAGDWRLARTFSGQVLPDLLERNRGRVLEALSVVRTLRLDRSGPEVAGEPDLKEGPGGLRDYHWLRWVLRMGPDRLSIAEGESIALTQSAAFLTCVRNGLQFLTGEMGNVVDETIRLPLGAALGYGGPDHSETGDRLIADCRSHLELIRDTAGTVQASITASG
jgi:[protein-PII] uridylyltransferase